MNATRSVLVLGVSLALALAACGTQGAQSQAGSRPSPSVTASGPSQSPADATRDRVVAELAALPLSVRMDVQQSQATPEGVWVLSRPTAAATKRADGCRLGPETGTYPTTTICTTAYGEVLLLDSSRTHVLRAYPLPSVPASFLRVTDDAVWCGRPGDVELSETSLPDAMLCRIDRRSLAARVRVFAPGAESEVMQPCFELPPNWTVQQGRLPMTDLQVDPQGVWARDASGTWTRLDPTTLAIVARGLTRAAATGG